MDCPRDFSAITAVGINLYNRFLNIVNRLVKWSAEICFRRMEGHFLQLRRALVLRLFLQCFGACCAMAHFSLLPQLKGLVGTDGLLPVKVCSLTNPSFANLTLSLLTLTPNLSTKPYYIPLPC